MKYNNSISAFKDVPEDYQRVPDDESNRIMSLPNALFNVVPILLLYFYYLYLFSFLFFLYVFLFGGAKTVFSLKKRVHHQKGKDRKNMKKVKISK